MQTLPWKKLKTDYHLASRNPSKTQILFFVPSYKSRNSPNLFRIDNLGEKFYPSEETWELYIFDVALSPDQYTSAVCHLLFFCHVHDFSLIRKQLNLFTSNMLAPALVCSNLYYIVLEFTLHNICSIHLKWPPDMQHALIPAASPSITDLDLEMITCT